METICELSGLSSDELCRIGKTLARRFDVRRDGNIRQLGFGVAERQGQIDPSRLDAVCFYVFRKRRPRAKADRIPARIAVRVRREQRFVLVGLATDVIEVDRRATTLTGRRIRHLSGDAFATAGAIVAWRTENSGPFDWGVITVGHLFREQRVVPEPIKNVRVRVRGNREIEGRLLLRSSRRDAVDAALVSVQRASLVRGAVLKANATTRRKRVRSIDQLITDQGAPGVTLPDQIPIPMTVLRYVPEFTLIPRVGRIRHVLDARSGRVNAFARGTSGAVWIIDDQASCHQFAGWQSTDPRQDYVRGAGQSLEFILDWICQQLAEMHGLTASDVDLRLIREL